MARPPFILWRMLALELGRLLLATTLVVVLIISFAAAIKPFADGQIGAFDMLLLVGILSVPMLQFALPFAGGFAATLSYHRFAADNELVAAKAGGMPLRTILFPAIAWGLTLAIAQAGLTNLVIPRFLRQAELLITRDVSRLIVNPIAAGRSLSMGNWDIYADDAVVNPTTDPGSTTISLVGMLAVRRDNDNRVQGYLADPIVELRLRDAAGMPDAPTGAGTAVWMFFDEPVGVMPKDDDPALDPLDPRDENRDPRSGPTVGVLSSNGMRLGPYFMATEFEEDPKFLTLTELLETLENPLTLKPVGRAAEVLALEIARARVVEALQQRLAAGRPLILAKGNEDRIIVRAAGIDDRDNGWNLTPLRPGAPLIVEREQPTGRTHYAATALRLTFEDDLSPTEKVLPITTQRAAVSGAGLRLTLDLQEVEIREREDAVLLTDRQRVLLSGYTPDAMPSALDTTLSPKALIEQGRSTTGDTPRAERVRTLADRFDRRLFRAHNEIISKIHERFAFVAASMLMVIAGATMALRLQNSTPLPVYLASFLPALLTVLAISTGQGITHKSGMVGLIVIWGGVVALGVFCFAQCRALARR